MSQGPERRAVLIAGPTASGKSARALARAEATGGFIVNTDAMQVYSGLSVVTARPQPADLARAEHALYGTIDPAERFSTGAWYHAVSQLIETNRGRELIFVGGTGLYFEALLNGIAPIPPVPPEVVAGIEAEVRQLDRAGRHRLLAATDPLMAQRLPEPDVQRLTRALAVLRTTGRSLAMFQDEGQSGLLEAFDIERLVLMPPRDRLRAVIANRFELMMGQGAVDEVEALLARNLDPSLPVMKAIGVREIGDWLAGRIDRETAIELAVIATRQYAKRQSTWFRNRMGDWPYEDPFR